LLQIAWGRSITAVCKGDIETEASKKIGYYVGRDAGYMLIKNEPYKTMNREMVERKYKKMERESNMV
jgi:hypothetical protein